MCERHKQHERQEASGAMAGACLLILAVGVGSAALYHWAYDKGWGDGRASMSEAVRRQYGAWRDAP